MMIRRKKVNAGTALVLTMWDITQMNSVDIEEISNKEPTKVKCIGYLHSEDRNFLRLKNFFDKETADILIIPKSLIVERKNIEV